MSLGPDLDRRQVLRGLAGCACLGALAACGVHPETSSPRALDRRLGELTGRLNPGQDYRPPSDAEARRAVKATEQLTADDLDAARRGFATVGFTVDELYDPAAQRDCLIAAGEDDGDRTWGMLVLAAGAVRPDVLVEVPHPRADLDTEHIGLDVFRAMPRSGLLVAGAHRRAAGGAADVAHRKDSLFHALAADLGRQGSFQLQLHGFADASLPGADVVISSGKAQVGTRAERLADALEGIGLGVCRAWHDRCPALEGRSNAQGRAAARHDLEFVHLELNHRTRMDLRRRSALVDAVAGTLNDH
ncbi:hypothetical protein V4U86_17290 [Mycobacterium sp. AMU20-3851]|uniref:hypothetical protein n=1 Tax=Mycobacterium sp. AMU20-3851 TaxID=3122055 RepID=UPI003754748F